MPKANKPGPERFFRVDHLSGDLRGRTVRGGAVTLANQGAKFAVNFVATIILARILAPEDFGLIAMVVPVITFVAIFKDMGLAMATVQRSEVNHAQVSTLFWINLAISAVLMLATFALAPLVVRLYNGESRLAPITLALAATLLVSGLSVQHQAILRRQMRFGALAGVEIASMVFGAVVAIGSALNGVGYWALVIMPVTRELSMSVFMWLVCRWRPGRPVRGSGVRVMLSFGLNLTAFNFVNYFARSVDRVLVGRLQGAVALGLYETAYRLVLLPIQQINLPLTNVAVPTLSRLQDQPERFRAYYMRGLTLAASAGSPLVAFLFVDAGAAVSTLLGARWEPAVPIFRVLAPAAFFGVSNVATGWVFVSLGHTRRQLAWGTFASAVTVAAFLIGSRWGAIGVAAALSIMAASLRVPALIYCFRPTPLRLRDALAALWRPTVAAVLAGGLLYAAKYSWSWPLGALPALFADFVLYALFYVLIWVGLPRGVRSAREMIAIAGELRPGPPPQSPPPDAPVA